MMRRDSQPLTTPQVVRYSMIALVSYFTALAIYRVFLHPLRKFPGPLRYKLSGWPLVWQAYTGDRHIWHLKDHEEYGPIVRIAPNSLSFNTASALNTIYGPRSANVEKGDWYKTFDIAAGTYSSLTETNKEKHAVKRRWMSPSFSTESITSKEAVIVGIIERFCDSLRPMTNDWGKKWNASVFATYLGFDIMGGLVFNHDFRSVHEFGNRHLADSILPAVWFLYWVSYLPFTAIVRPLLRTRLFEMLGGRPVVDNNRLIDFASSQVQSRKENVGHERGLIEGHTDFLSRLISTKDKKNEWRPTTADLDTECLNLINAGADPYSGVLAGMIFYLVHNQHALRKATEEVRSIFTSPDEIRSGTKLNTCVYLYACIEETLRRATPVPSHLPRVVLCGGINIDGHHLPEGTVVGVPAYVTHHDPTHFPEPWSFKPERWVESDSVSKKSISLARKAYWPFGLGTRQCIGKSLAYLQFRLTLAHLLFRYDMRLSPDEPGRGAGSPGIGLGREREDEFQLWDAFGFARDGPMVEFRLAKKIDP